MFKVKCPMCNGEAEIVDVEYNLDYVVIGCPTCKKDYACGIRDWEVDGEMELD